MASVELRFSPLPAHVRTARLVGAAIARRAGIEEPLLDEVRLAVGEACSRAVGRHRQAAVRSPVVVRLVVEGDRFRVEVEDAVPVPARTQAPGDVAHPEPALGGAGASEQEQDLSLALISGLVDQVEVASGEGARSSA